MKKIMLLGLALVITIILAGCGTQALSVKTATSSATEGAGSLPAATQLVVGTLKLEGTDQAANAEQAQDLLPLWKAYRSMSGSSSSSAVELQALVKQAQGSMTEKQLAAITAMELTADDVSAVMQAQGIDEAESAPSEMTSNKPTASGQPPMGEGAPMGDGDGGGPVEGGGVPGEMPAGGASGTTTSSGARTSSAGNTAVSTALLDALIDILAAKA